MKNEATLFDKVGRSLDRALGVFAPGLEVKRQAARIAAEHGRRQYAAAKVNLSHGNWNPANPGINELLATSRPQLLARTRQLVRDFPFFTRAINTLVDFVVGEGLILRPAVLDADGKPMKELNRKILDAWQWWLDEADLSGSEHGLELMRLAKRQEVETGEALVIKRITRERGRFLPFALSMIESDRLTDFGTATPGAAIWEGVEYDPLTGKKLGYHLGTNAVNPVFGTSPGSDYKVTRVAAENVVHVFETLRPGQLRGVTPFAAGIVLADALHDYVGAEIDAARMASRFLAFVTAPDPVAMQSANGAIADAHNNRKVEELGTAITQYLAPGEQVELASPNRQGTGFTPFARFIIQTLAISTGTTYELLSGDYSGMNYTTLKAARGDLVQTLRPAQRRHVRQFCQPIYRDFMTYAVLAGRLDIPDFFANPRAYCRAEWLDAGLESLDPLKEGRAAADAVTALIDSPQSWIRKRGRDPEDVLQECAEYAARAKELGLVAGTTSSALQGAPSHLKDTKPKPLNGDDVIEEA